MQVNQDCSICHEILETDLIKLGCCKQLMHKKCIDEWLKNNNLCPLCKENVFDSYKYKKCCKKVSKMLTISNETKDKFILIIQYITCMVPFIPGVIILSNWNYNNIYAQYNDITFLYIEHITMGGLIILYIQNNKIIVHEYFKKFLYLLYPIIILSYHIYDFLFIPYMSRRTFYNKNTDSKIKYSDFIGLIVVGLMPIFIVLFFLFIAMTSIIYIKINTVFCKRAPNYQNVSNDVNISKNEYNILHVNTSIDLENNILTTKDELQN